MADENLNHYQRMDAPRPREAEDLRRAGKGTKSAKKSSARSVSVNTFRRSGGVITFIVWLAFALAIAYGSYFIVQLFMAG